MEAVCKAQNYLSRTNLVKGKREIFIDLLEKEQLKPEQESKVEVAKELVLQSARGRPKPIEEQLSIETHSLRDEAGAKIRISIQDFGSEVFKETPLFESAIPNLREPAVGGFTSALQIVRDETIPGSQFSSSSETEDLDYDSDCPEEMYSVVHTHVLAMQSVLKQYEELRERVSRRTMKSSVVRFTEQPSMLDSTFER